jgi:hypothetical protein
MISHDVPSSSGIIPDSVPIRRRTKGQRAMECALSLGINNKTTTEAAAEAGVSQASVAQAHVVNKCAPDLVPGILDGEMTLQAGYLLCKARRAVEAAAAQPTAQQLRDAAIEAENRRRWSTGRE